MHLVISPCCESSEAIIEFCTCSRCSHISSTQRPEPLTRGHNFKSKLEGFIDIILSLQLVYIDLYLRECKEEYFLRLNTFSPYDYTGPTLGPKPLSLWS